MTHPFRPYTASKITALLLCLFITSVSLASDDCNKALQPSPFRTSARQMEGYEALNGMGVPIDLRYFLEKQRADKLDHFFAGLTDIFERHPYLKNQTAFSEIIVRKNFEDAKYTNGIVIIDGRARMSKIEKHLIRQYEQGFWQKALGREQLIQQMQKDFKDQTGIGLNTHYDGTEENFSKNKKAVLVLLELFFKYRTLFQEIKTISIDEDSDYRDSNQIAVSFYSSEKQIKSHLEIRIKKLQKHESFEVRAKDKNENSALQQLNAKTEWKLENTEGLENLFKKNLSELSVVTSILEREALQKAFFEITGVHLQISSIRATTGELLVFALRLEALFKKDPTLFQGINRITLENHFNDIDQYGGVEVKDALFDFTLRRFFVKQQKLLKEQAIRKQKVEKITQMETIFRRKSD